MATPPDPRELELRARVKDEIRRRIRVIRRALPEEARRARSQAIAERVLALPEYASARNLAAFAPIRGEVDVRPIVEAAWSAGKTVLLPRVDPGAQRIVLHAHTAEDALDEGSFGVPEPAPGAPTVAGAAVDLVLVPALAADPRGHRIGYGKGFYDRLLPELVSATACAVIYDFQLVSEVPEMPGDVAVDLVVTDTRTLRVE